MNLGKWKSLKEEEDNEDKSPTCAKINNAEVTSQ